MVTYILRITQNYHKKRYTHVSRHISPHRKMKLTYPQEIPPQFSRVIKFISIVPYSVKWYERKDRA